MGSAGAAAPRSGPGLSAPAPPRTSHLTGPLDIGMSPVAVGPVSEDPQNSSAQDGYPLGPGRGHDVAGLQGACA